MKAQTTYYWAGLNSGLTGATSGTDYNDVNNWSSTLVSKTAVTSLPTSNDDVNISTTSVTSITLSGNATVRKITISTASVDIQTNTLSLYGSGSPITLNSGGSLILTSGTVEYGAAALNQTLLTTTYNHLLLTGTLARTCIGSLTVLGNLTINGPTFTMGAFDHYFAGNFTRIAGSNGTTGTIFLNGNGNQTFSTANTVFNMVVSGGGTKTINSNVVINNQLTIETGTTFNCDNNVLYFRGLSPIVPLVKNGTGTLNCGTGTVVYDGAGNQNLVGNNYNKLTCNSGTKTMVGNVSVASTFIINASTILNTDIYELTSNSTISNSGTLDASSGTLKYSSSASINMNSGSSSTYLVKNLIISGSGTKTMNYNFSVTNDVTIETGSNLNLSSRTLTLTKVGTTPLIVNGTLNSSTGKVLYAGSGDQPITSGFTYYNLETGGSGIKTISGNITVSNVLTIGDGTQFGLGSNTLTLSLVGTPISVIGSGNFSPGTGTVVYSNGNQNIAGLTYYNLTTSTSGTKTVAGDLIINGVLTVGAGTTFSLGSLSMTLNFVGTPFVMNGTFSPNTSTIRYAGAGNQNMAIVAYFNLITEGGGIKKATGTTGVSGILTVENNTTFDLNSRTLRLSGVTPVVLNGTGNVTISTGTVDYRLLGDQNIIDLPYYSIQLTGSGTKKLLQDVTLNGNLFINSGNTLDLNNNSLSLNYVGTPIVNNGGNFTAGTGTVIYKGAGNQSIAAYNYHNLTLSGSGLKTLMNSSDISGVVTVNSNLSLSTYQLKLLSTGTPLVVSGTFTPGTGTVEYADAGVMSQNIAPVTYYNLTLTGGGPSPKLFTANTTIQNNFYYDACSPYFYAYTITVGGNFTRGTTGILSGTNSTIHLNGIAAQSFNAPITVTDFICSNGGVKTLDSDLTLSGTLTINASSSFNLSSRTLTLTSSSATTVVNNGTLTPSTSTVIYARTGDQTIASGISYYNLQTSGSGTKEVDGNTTVSNVLTLGNNTTFKIGIYTLSLTKSGTPIVKVGTGDLLANSGSVNYASPTTQNILPLAYYNLQVNTSATLLGNIEVTGILLVNSSKSLDVDNTNNYSITLRYVGAPFVNLGTFIPRNGTITYAGNGNQTIAAGTFYNVDVNGASGTKTLGGTLVLNNNLTIAASNTFSLGSNMLNIMKLSTSWLTNSGTFSTGTGTINYAGFGNQVVESGFMYYSLSTGGSGTKILQNNLDLNGVLTIGTGTTLASSSYGIVLNGTGTPFVNNGTFDPGTGYVRYRTGVQYVAGATYYDLQLQDAAQKTLNANAVVLNSIDMAGGCTFKLSNLFLELRNTTSSIFTGSGTLDTETSTVQYNGAGNQSIYSTSYYNLDILNSGTKSLSNNLTVNGVLTIGTSATLDANNYNITLNYIGTPFVVNGTFITGAGQVEYRGAGNQNIAPTTFYDLQVSNSGIKYINGSTTINNRITANGSVTLQLNGGVLTLNRTGDSFNLLGSPLIYLDNGTTIYNASGNQNVAAFTYDQLICQGSGTKTLRDETSVLTQVQINNATFDVNGTLLTVNGDNDVITTTGTGVFTASTFGSEVHYTSGTNQSIYPTTYRYLYLTNNTKNLLGNTDVRDQLVINSGTTLQGGVYELNLSGDNIPFINNGSFDGGTGLVRYGGRNQQVAQADYYNLQIRGGLSYVKTLNANIKVRGELQIRNDGNLNLNGFELNLSMNGDPLTIDYPGTLTTTGTVKFSGDDVQNVNGIMYDNLTISNTGNRIQQGGIVCNGLFSVEADARYDFNGMYFSFLKLGTCAVIDGTTDASSAYLQFDGAGNQDIPFFHSHISIVHCSNSGTKTMTGDVEVDKLTLDVPMQISNYDLTIDQTYPGNINLLQMGSNSGLHLNISQESGNINFIDNQPIALGRLSLNNSAVTFSFKNLVEVGEMLNLFNGTILLNSHELRLNGNSSITRTNGQIDASSSNDLLRARSRQSSLIIPEGTFVNDELNELVVENTLVLEAVVLETDLKILENIDLNNADINLNGKSLEILGSTSFVCEPCFYATTTQSHLIVKNGLVNNFENLFFDNNAASKLTVNGSNGGTQVIYRGEELFIFNELNVTNGGFIDFRGTNLILEYTSELYSDAPAQVKLDEGILTAKCPSINANFFVDNTILDFQVSNDWTGAIEVQGTQLVVTGGITLNNSDLNLAISSVPLIFTGSVLDRPGSGSILASSSQVNINTGGSLSIPKRMFSDIKTFNLINTSVDLSDDFQVNEEFIWSNSSINTNGYALILGNHIGAKYCKFSDLNTTDNNHINGKVIRYYGANLNDIYFTGFPVGNGTDNRLVSVAFSNTVEGYLSVEFVPGLPQDVYTSFPLEETSSGLLIQTTDASGHWEIIPYDVNMDAYQGDMDVTPFDITLRVKNPTSYQNGYTISDPSVMRLIKAKGHTNGSHDPWDIEGTIATSYQQNTGDFILEATNVTGFSWFNVGSTLDQPLPVVLSSFSANCDEENIQLNWTTASEHNSASFELEKSRDGETWNSVASLVAAGNSNSNLNYMYIDSKVSDVMYYRLVQNDIDGNSKKYDPIVVNCNEDLEEFYTLPNPSKENFNLYFNTSIENQVISLEIVDELGRRLGSKSIAVQKGVNVISSPFTNLKKGIYSIVVDNGNDKKKIYRHIIAE